jgi:hypothetical protein
MAEAGFCDSVCGWSDSLCGFFVAVGTCDSSYSGQIGGGGGGGVWDPLATCTSQVTGNGEVPLASCESCCGYMHPSPLEEADLHACDGHCITDHS